MDWWQYVDSLPKPRIMVLEDMDHRPGIGAFVGEIHAAIGMALTCVGCITDGAVRDLPEVEAMKFQLFSGNVSVSHSYAHIIEMGEPVEVGGLKVSSGDLLAGDRHGVLNIPLEIADEVAGKAAQVRARELELIRFCQSPEFTIEELENRLKAGNPGADLPWPLK
jgi:regulator of RNase E activity RraA